MSNEMVLFRLTNDFGLARCFLLQAASDNQTQGVSLPFDHALFRGMMAEAA